MSSAHTLQHSDVLSTPNKAPDAITKHIKHKPNTVIFTFEGKKDRKLICVAHLLPKFWVLFMCKLSLGFSELIGVAGVLVSFFSPSHEAPLAVHSGEKSHGVVKRRFSGSWAR